MSGATSFQPSMIERMERALVVLAYFIEQDGDFWVPMYERFEVGLMAHETVNKAIRSFSRNQSILETMSQRSD